MVKNFDRNNVKEDEAKAALRCGLLIASKPFFSAMSSYMWGRSGDRIGFKFNILVSVIFVAAINLAFGFAETYTQAVWVRSLSGFFDGIVVLVGTCGRLVSGGFSGLGVKSSGSHHQAPFYRFQLFFVLKKENALQVQVNFTYEYIR